MNRLLKEKSSYLRKSAHQKIDWYPWSEEAFEKAKNEDKPIFLSSGATWCHWCHVMAEECFENEEIVGILNRDFISIKLDRDERPDIDRRFQRAVAAMGYSTGWPLSVFLTPDKTPFFGGTYFPPDDMHGRPGFKKILNAVSEFYRSKRDEVYEYSNRLMNLLKTEQLSKGNISKTMLNDAVDEIISKFDPQNGGFGTAPKFPMPGAIEFLMNRYFFDNKESIAITVKKTLEAMAKGGFHDQLGGGFHRYSTDEEWIIPHFEKMADDNAWLLRNYINAYLLFKDEYFRDTAKGIINFLRSELSDTAGGFYVSQDADITPDDEGGYFTWKEEDLRKILNEEEYRVLSLHLLHNRGSMHHDSTKKVLFIAKEPELIAKELKISQKRVLEIIDAAKAKLIAERRKRKSPFIDKTMYTSLNCMLISSYFLTYKVLKEDYLKEFGLLSLKKVIEKNLINGELFHSEGVKAMLDDYVNFIDALISAYEVSGDKLFILKADEIMQICLNKFWDKEQGGFFDTSEEVLDLRLKGIEDVPHPSANSLGIMQLIRLFNHTNRFEYLRYAETALETFSIIAKDIGIHSGYYFCALDAYYNMLRLTFHIPKNSRLSDFILSSFSPYTSIIYEEDRGYVLPCIRTECYNPITTEKDFENFLLERKK